MTKDKTGGPAFPSKDIRLAYPKDVFPVEIIQRLHEIKVEHQGMTLREYFAGQALVGVLSNTALIEALGKQSTVKNISPTNLLAAACYEYADAMLAERDRQ